MPALIATITKNLAKYSDAVSYLVNDIKAKITAEDFVGAGKECAYLVEVAIGKVEPAPP